MQITVVFCSWSPLESSFFLYWQSWDQCRNWTYVDNEQIIQWVAEQSLRFYRVGSSGCSFSDVWEIKFRLKRFHSQEEAFPRQVSWPFFPGHIIKAVSSAWLPAFMRDTGIWYLWDLLPLSNSVVIGQSVPKLLGGWEEKGMGRQTQTISLHKSHFLRELE